MKTEHINSLPIIIVSVALALGLSAAATVSVADGRDYNGSYTGAYLNKVAFPIGGIGAGMFCLEGAGAISHVSVKNRMDFFNEPCTFAAVCIKGSSNVARVVEGPIPDWKYFGSPMTGRGSKGASYGLPRFREASFLARFPFATVSLTDDAVPLDVEITGWSPFIPSKSDDSSLPVGAMEYRFKNPTDKRIEGVFSFHSRNFMAIDPRRGHSIAPMKGGFVLTQPATKEAPHEQGRFAVFVDDKEAVVDHGWFRGAHYDAFTLVWKNITEGVLLNNPAMKGPSPGASLYVPFSVAPGGRKTIRLMVAWYVPRTNIKIGLDPKDAPECKGEACCSSPYYVPWYACHFKSLAEVTDYWRKNYDRLRKQSALFRDAFYDTTLPDEVVEAVAANLTILKSPTVLRQADGRLWCFEGCNDDSGCCHGTCTHVWNYAQAICHLFPDLERTLRETEFKVSQDDRGHQVFRTSLPVRPVEHHPRGRLRYAAADGQLGGIMKMYREWRISGDTKWLKSLWPRVKQSLEYCMETWDPRQRGALEEPHHNTYDIEYWGPDGHCTSFYLGALAAAIEMGEALNEDMSRFRERLDKGKSYLETKLYNGEYFYQKIMTEGLDAKFQPLNRAANGPGYKPHADLINSQGPRYQYGTGCLSDGVLGFWIAHMCGLDGNIVDRGKIRSNLRAIYKYNLRQDLSAHANPQRPSYAMGDDGGLLLCTWPKGGQIAIPFIYSNEVWTGIEYQVASHLMLEGMVDEGLEIVRVCRDRYDGVRRNPFNEYECGHWYARALSSYGLVQGLTGVRYDAVDKTLYVDSQVGDDFRCFFSCETGFGTVGLREGKPFVEMKMGDITTRKIIVSGQTL
jgi:uncharacterized protein (DUF608 family)